MPLSSSSRQKVRLNQEECHRRAERANWQLQNRLAGLSVRLTIFSVVVSAIASLGTVAAVVFAGQALKQSRLQSIAAQDQDRPWLKVVLGSATMQWFEPPSGQDGVFTPSLTVENVGHSPAFEVKAAVRPVYSPDQRALDEEQGKACKGLLIKGQYRGHVLYPGDRFDPLNLGQFDIVVGVLPGAIRRFAQPGPSGTTQLHLQIVGCVDYIFGSPAVHHQAPFSYDVQRTDNGKPVPKLSFFTVGEDLHASNIQTFETYTDRQPD